MTLHEELEQILLSTRRPMTTSELASAVNRRGNYRKRDGSTVTAYQIHGRTKNYPDLFTRSGVTVGLVRWGPDLNVVCPDIAAPGNAGPGIPQTLFRLTPDSNYLVHGDVHLQESLEKNGFESIGDMGSLFSKGLPGIAVIDSCGVYAISVPVDYKPEFIDPSKARANGNVISPWSVGRLQKKWVAGANVVYYGLAGRDRPRSLRNRLNDLLRHGNGETTDRGPHKGGEILWQLNGYTEFTLWAKATGNPPAPRNTEAELLHRFQNVTGMLPFANRQP